MGRMDMTGWLNGQVFLSTLDEKEVQEVTAFLNARGLAFQVLTLSERMVLDPQNPEDGVTTDRFSIAVQLGGFPQVLGPVLNDLIQRSHGGAGRPRPASSRRSSCTHSVGTGVEQRPTRDLRYGGVQYHPAIARTGEIRSVCVYGCVRRRCLRGERGSMLITDRRSRHVLAVCAAAAVLAGSLAACGAGKKDSGSSSSGSGGSSGGKPITIGTTDKVVALDPAGSYDNGSLMLETQVYQYLMAIPPGGKTPQPDAAESCSFTQPTEYTCKMKPGLKFSNGDPLTAKDVAFSFTRIVKINDPNGPASLLANMVSATASDDSTVVFKLRNGDDQTWAQILGTSAGPIVDSKVFPADKLLADDKVIGSGQYKLGSYSKNTLVQLQANPNYAGAFKAKTADVTLKYYTQASNLKLDIQSGAIDVAWRSLTSTDVDSLRKVSGVKVDTGPGGEMRYMVFNFKTMPGSTDAQKLAVRRAMAYSVDRQSISDKVYKGTYKPAYSMIPDGLPGHVDAFKDEFGASPDKAKATSELQQAGIKT